MLYYNVYQAIPFTKEPTMRRLFAALALMTATVAQADPPKVVTDIRPVHSIVSMVTDGVGDVEVLLRPGASPHSYSMRPSEAAALDQADLVVWIGPGLTPWLEDALDTLADQAKVLTLLDEAPHQIELKEEEDGHDHGHDHGDIDPHLWLDPQNAIHWLGEIADALSEIDPENGGVYRANAEQASGKILGLEQEIRAQFSGSTKPSFAVQHDAYRYFEARFGLQHSFAITDSHAVEPGPARIAELRDSVRSESISCILTDGIEAMGLLETVIEGHQTRVVATDPTGAGFTPGPLLYMDMMSGFSLALANC
jgi:zinc transport system substrate-binding protein